MLTLLHIENIAVIERSDITFDRGFNVLTGETGAGKSIVIDAISAILGERAYRDMIRTGAQKASVRAVFDQVPQLSWFAENGVPHEEEIVVQRDIFLDGKNACRVNGMPVTVTTLKKLGVQLINIHGQHDSAALFDETYHLTFLDNFACPQEMAHYSEYFSRMQKLQREIDRLSMDEGEKLRRMETLQYQIEEITKAKLQPGEDEILEDRRKVLQNSERITNGLVEASGALNGGDNYDGAGSMLTNAEYALGRIAKYDDAIAQLHDLVKDLMYQVMDAGEQVRDRLGDLADSAQELETIEERLDVIHRLRRKYGATCTDILEYLDKAQKELEDMEFSGDRLERLRGQLEGVKKETLESAVVLRRQRQEAAKILTAAILEELRQLDMPKVRFECRFTQTEPGVNGADAVAFYMSANAGEALKPMNKVASGGELARIMLAMKNVLAEKDLVPTLIFDEVDTGVSGRAAQKVAEKLRSVARTKQVLCVTHLPQIAALAHTHLLIAKSEREGRTFTSVTPLDTEGRKQELARIIGGTNITETTLKSAEEMLRIGE